MKLRIGQPHPLGSRCPVCDCKLTLSSTRHGIYVCPVAKREEWTALGYQPGAHRRSCGRKPDAIHSETWVYSELDCEALVAGQPCSWHYQRDRLVALESGRLDDYRALSVRLGELLKAS